MTSDLYRHSRIHVHTGTHVHNHANKHKHYTYVPHTQENLKKKIETRRKQNTANGSAWKK